VRRRRYERATWVRSVAHRPLDVSVRWPWHARWFSEVSFTPYLRVVASPRESDFLPGVISLEVREFDPRTGLRYDDDAGWRSTDSTWTNETWPRDKKRRFKFRIPPPLLPGDGTYQCRIQFGELEEVDENEFTTLTNSYF
jgi:hypothetical protein